MPPGNLCLEITETAAVRRRRGRPRSRLRDLRALGVTLALDDFGTGYSSLTLLRHLPVDLVKIDRSFVAHLTSDAQDAVLGRLVVDAAHAMGMQVCAEGVETVEQARQLVALGCDRAQGWYYAAAHPPGRRLDAALTLERPLLDAPGTRGAPDLPMTGSDELVLVTDPHGVRSRSRRRPRCTCSARRRRRSSARTCSTTCSPAHAAAAVGPDGGLREGTARMRARRGHGARPGAAGGRWRRGGRHGGGPSTWLEVRTSTVHRHDGRPRQALSVARDVTAIVSAEEETLASERRFRHAFDDAPIGMAMTTLDGAFIRVNRSFAHMLGLPPGGGAADHGRPSSRSPTTAPPTTPTSPRRGRGDAAVHDLHKRYLHRDGHRGAGPGARRGRPRRRRRGAVHPRPRPGLPGAHRVGPGGRRPDGLSGHRRAAVPSATRPAASRPGAVRPGPARRPAAAPGAAGAAGAGGGSTTSSYSWCVRR